MNVDYLEAVRLHLWYTPSKFSFFQGKAKKDTAKLYLEVAHKALERK